jgi:hypothetical protein
MGSDKLEKLFRAKPLISNKKQNTNWIEGYYCKNIFQQDCIQTLNYQMIEIDKNTLSRNTGLLHKNKGYFWENDVVEYNSWKTIIFWDIRKFCWSIKKLGVKDENIQYNINCWMLSDVSTNIKFLYNIFDKIKKGN